MGWSSFAEARRPRQPDPANPIAVELAPLLDR
jgi:hypothetical protein